MYAHKMKLLCLQLGLGFVFAADPSVMLPSDGQLPVFTLPYAAYRATNYSSIGDIYTFKNIRYAAAPVGNLRWAKPAAPQNENGVQDGSYGPHCIQTAQAGANFVGNGGTAPVGGAPNQFLGGEPVPLFAGGKEDCLFLDVYVPAKALKDPSMKLPVAVYIYGGGYLFGSKDAFQPSFPYYDGSGLIESSGGNTIVVAMNYRLGGFGFLAGTTMEKEGLPNAGLWDQRAAFRWVKDNIHAIGGDPSAVTAIGQASGAGSLMHHIVAQGGKLDPLFSKAILLSTSYQSMWDRDGQIQRVFEGFATKAGCQGQGLSCLRKASVADLTKANDALSGMVPEGSSPVGPSADGSYIRQLPVLELSSGKFWNLDSMIVSHCADETSPFADANIVTDSQFTTFIENRYPQYVKELGITDLILKAYPAVGLGVQGPYLTEAQRFAAFLRDSSFTCYGRSMTEYLRNGTSRRVWNMQYSVSPGTYGSDLLTMFYNQNLTSLNTVMGSLVSLFTPLTAAVYSGLSVNYQSYMTSYITTGDPNTKRVRNATVPTIQWDQPDTSKEQVTGVLDVGTLSFSTVSDSQSPKTSCDFWKNVAAAVTNGGGYAPPDTVVSQNLVNITNDPSYRFKSGSGTHGDTPGNGASPSGGKASLGTALAVPIAALIFMAGPMMFF
ncbi:lipase 2 [Pyricularia oryzae]|nr:lipase 2 [Pyricularia oryzae Y34]KAI7930158.1 lipase 2 [Pyricularia oryzae]KAI7930319.1 lipase 2 [Pyricularia oryzae]